MNKLTKYGTIIFSTALLLTACSSQKEQTNSTNSSTEQKSEPKVAYDFTALDKDGKEVKLSNFKGKKVYINTWASWCGPCVKEIPELEKVYQKLKNTSDVVFLSITSPNDDMFKNTSPADKSKDTILSKAKELGATYPVLFDVNDRFFVNYTIRSFPTHIFINSDGTINEQIPGMMNEEILEQHIKNLK